MASIGLMDCWSLVYCLRCWPIEKLLYTGKRTRVRNLCTHARLPGVWPTILSLEIVLLKICFVARIASELETQKFGWGALEIPSSIQWKAGHAITKNSPKSLDSTQSSPRIGYEFFFSVPAHWNPMQWDIWAGHERRVAFWFFTKKNKNKKIKSPVHKTKGKKKILYNDFSKKIVTQTRETQMKNKAIRQKKISMPRWLFPSF